MEASVAYSASEWMQLVFIGGLFGAFGQAIRVIPGLKKMADQAGASDSTFAREFSASRLLVTLLIGAIAGALGAISLGVPVGDKPIETSMIIALLGVGYSGADFIEAFMSRYGPPRGSAGAARATLGPDAAVVASQPGISESGKAGDATAQDLEQKAVG